MERMRGSSVVFSFKQQLVGPGNNDCSHTITPLWGVFSYSDL